MLKIILCKSSCGRVKTVIKFDYVSPSLYSDNFVSKNALIFSITLGAFHLQGKLLPSTLRKDPQRPPLSQP